MVAMTLISRESLSWPLSLLPTHPTSTCFFVRFKRVVLRQQISYFKFRMRKPRRFEVRGASDEEGALTSSFAPRASAPLFIRNLKLPHRRERGAVDRVAPRTDRLPGSSSPKISAQIAFVLDRAPFRPGDRWYDRSTQGGDAMQLRNVPFPRRWPSLPGIPRERELLQCRLP